MSYFLSIEDRQKIIEAIQKAEQNCSGEVRVHFDRRCKGDVLEAAAQTFARLDMQRTKLRNGILFYVAYRDRKFAVIGDLGINQRVPNDFWNQICEMLEQYFKSGDYVGGLCKGIELCGDQLKTYFPHQSDDVNELPDDISFGNK